MGSGAVRPPRRGCPFDGATLLVRGLSDSEKPRILAESGAMTRGDGGNRTRVRRQIVGTSPGAVREAVS